MVYGILYILYFIYWSGYGMVYSIGLGMEWYMVFYIFYILYIGLDLVWYGMILVYFSYNYIIYHIMPLWTYPAVRHNKYESHNGFQ